MAPNNNNNKKETPDILGSVSQYSSRYNAGAARRDDGKRGQASSTDGIVRKKIHEDKDSGLTPTGSGSGDKHLPSGSVSLNRPSRDEYSSTNRLPSGRQTDKHLSSDSVSLNRLPQVVDSNDEDGNVGALTCENEVDNFPDSDLDGLLEADIERLIGSARANEADEFSDLDVEDLTEVDFEQLESQALGQAPVVDEDDGPKTCGNAVDEFLDSDLDGLSETDIQRLVGQAVPESAKAVDGGDSEAPVMAVDESGMGVESVDIDAQILDKDRIDVHVSNVEDDGMEYLIDESFVPHEHAAEENQSLIAAELVSGVAPAEQVFYDRVLIVCDKLCEYAREEVKWNSMKSPFSIGSWNWFRQTEAGKLAGVVFKYVSPEARRILSAPRPDVLDLLDLPVPKRNDLADSCNSAGVYVFVCHAERKVDPRSGDSEAISNDMIACYTGQSIAKPQKNGREGMSLRFDQHRRELSRTLAELQEKAKKSSTNVPRFYRTVVEHNLEAHPRVVATLPRDSELAGLAMLIETVIMLMTGSVSEESSYGLPTRDIVADIQEQLSYEGRLKHQPMTLNRALPAHQGFRSNVRVFRKCELCEHNSSNYTTGFHTSPYTQECLCRGCLGKQITERCRPELAEMGRVATLKIPKHRDTCENPDCPKTGRMKKSSGWSIMHDDLVLCKACKHSEVYNFEREVLESEFGTEDPVDKTNVVCEGPSCIDRTQRNMTSPKWVRSRVHLAEGREVWFCYICRQKEKKTEASKIAEAKLEGLQDSGIRIPGLARKAIPHDMRYCQNSECPKTRKNNGIPVQLDRKAPAKWSLDPDHPTLILCSGCFEQDRKALVRKILAKNGIDSDRRRLNIPEKDKFCTEEGCEDPLQEQVKARMEAGEMVPSGHIWYRHPMEKGGRVLCAPCRKAILQYASSKDAQVLGTDASYKAWCRRGVEWEVFLNSHHPTDNAGDVTHVRLCVELSWGYSAAQLELSRYLPAARILIADWHENQSSAQKVTKASPARLPGKTYMTKPKPSTTKPKPSATKPKPSTTKPKPSTTKPSKRSLTNHNHE
ncbi:hypothetical protein FGADI_5314 [Fusarium gaditjirri]|uniref:Uncharacterized protein n=1 Tax=Fusarium gaditjirri TaxID=282569 RepID=A0A8H4TAP8_9HYPO|nr:hypothetical protein FGADI_5314 [Fusarium gaditjirri]